MRKLDAAELREHVRAHPSANLRTKHCGKTRFKTEVELLASAGSSGWWDGVVRCRARECPVCWIARRAKLAREITHVVEARTASTKARAVLGTFTIRHHAGHHVKITRDVRTCWRAMLQHRSFRTLRREHSLEWIVAEEVTHGANGWHPHMHALLLPAREFSIRNPWANGDLFDLWCAIVRKKMGSEHEPNSAHGVDLRYCSAGRYLAKIGFELQDPGAVKGRAPIAMLRAGQLEQYMRLMQERRRARDLSFSRGLRSLRDSLPAGDGFTSVARLSGTEWGRLAALGHAVPMEIESLARDPNAARAQIADKLGGLAEWYEPRKPSDFNETE